MSFDNGKLCIRFWLDVGQNDALTPQLWNDIESPGGDEAYWAINSPVIEINSHAYFTGVFSLPD